MKYRIIEECRNDIRGYYVEEEHEVGFWIFKDTIWVRLKQAWGNDRRFDSYTSACNCIDGLHPSKTYVKIVGYVET